MPNEKQNYIHPLLEKPKPNIKLIRLHTGQAIYHCKLRNDTIFQFGAHTNPATAYLNWRTKMLERPGHWKTFLQLDI